MATSEPKMPIGTNAVTKYIANVETTAVSIGIKKYMAPDKRLPEYIRRVATMQETTNCRIKKVA
jgi:hypothetical protein